MTSQKLKIGGQHKKEFLLFSTLDMVIFILLIYINVSFVFEAKVLMSVGFFPLLMPFVGIFIGYKIQKKKCENNYSIDVKDINVVYALRPISSYYLTGKTYFLINGSTLNSIVLSSENTEKVSKFLRFKAADIKYKKSAYYIWGISLIVTCIIAFIF